MVIKSWAVYALLSAVFAALTAIFAKAGLKDVNSDLAMAIRTAVILFITWGIVSAKNLFGQIADITAYNWVFLTLSAIATGMSWLFYYRALQIGKASEVSVIDKSSLMFTLILAFFFLKEPLTPRLLLGAGLMLTGMLVVIWK